MKYKVLKEMLGYDGELLCPGEEWVLKDSECEGARLRTLKAFVKHGFIKEVSGYEPWKPKIGDKYFVVFGNGEIGCDFWHDESELPMKRLSIGNVSKTEEEAEKKARRLKAIKVLQDDTKGFEPDLTSAHQPKWYVWWNILCQKLVVNACRSSVEHAFYFATEADALESIENHPEEWLIYLKVKDGSED